MPIVKYNTIPIPKYLKDLACIIALFIPLPTEEYTPDFVIFEYGFASTIAISSLRIPLGLIMISIALIF